MNFIITNNAQAKIQSLIIEDGNLLVKLRITVEGGGCSGFQYKYLLDETIKPDDFIFDATNPLVIIDNISMDFLNDCTLDYIEDLGSAGFEIRNPKAKLKCGCGNSFTI